ncbi:hypothetical protein ACLOJK_009595 [Asimina triloba]
MEASCLIYQGIKATQDLQDVRHTSARRSPQQAVVGCRDDLAIDNQLWAGGTEEWDAAERKLLDVKEGMQFIVSKINTMREERLSPTMSLGFGVPEVSGKQARQDYDNHYQGHDKLDFSIFLFR